MQSILHNTREILKGKNNEQKWPEPLQKIVKQNVKDLSLDLYHIIEIILKTFLKDFIYLLKRDHERQYKQGRTAGRGRSKAPR